MAGRRSALILEPYETQRNPGIGSYPLDSLAGALYLAAWPPASATATREPAIPRS